MAGPDRSPRAVYWPLMLSLTCAGTARPFWDQQYREELEACSSCTSLEGKLASLYLWYGDEPIAAIVLCLSRMGLPLDAAVLDVGCGNGHMSLLLAARGYSNVTGSDVSEHAVSLARHVMAAYGSAGSSSPLAARFVCDDMCATRLAPRSFAAIVDKGSLDSVSLEGLEHAYLRGITRALAPDGVYVVASMTTTAAELRDSLAEAAAAEAQCGEEARALAWQEVALPGLEAEIALADGLVLLVFRLAAGGQIAQG